MNPLVHYLSTGWREGRDPGPVFSGEWYLSRYPDVAVAGVNPLVHYLSTGWREGRRLESQSDLVGHNAPGGLRTSELGAEIIDWEFVSQTWISLIPQQDPEYSLEALSRLGIPPNRRVANRLVAELPDKPTFAIVMPTFNSSPELLMNAVLSVTAQLYPHWRLLIGDDGSTSSETKLTLRAIAELDPRIEVRFFNENRGISSTTNELLEGVREDYVAFMDHDDSLTVDCLFEFAKLACAHPFEMAYSDEAVVSDRGVLVNPHLKPQWSPMFFLGVMYVGHLLVLKTEFRRRVGWLDPAFDMVQDFEFGLRASALAGEVRHLSRPLYRWRQAPTSVAGGGKSDVNFEALQLAAVREAISKRRLPCYASAHPRQSHRVSLHPVAEQVPIADIRQIVIDGRLGTSIANVTESLIAAGPEAQFPIDWLRKSVPTLIRDSNCHLASADISRLAAWLKVPKVMSVGPVVSGGCGTVLSSGLRLSSRQTVVDMDRGCSLGDGYAGSLSCVREVFLPSPHFFLFDPEKASIARQAEKTLSLRHLVSSLVGGSGVSLVDPTVVVVTHEPAEWIDELLLQLKFRPGSELHYSELRDLLEASGSYLRDWSGRTL